MKALKVLSAAALVGVSVAALSSCSRKDYSHTVVFHHAAGQALQKEIDTAIENFEAKYPEWTVEQAGIGGYNELYTGTVSNLTAGTQPDLAFCYSDHVAKYITSGKVVDMANYINSDKKVVSANGDVAVGYTAEEIKDFAPGYYAEGKATNYADYTSYGFTENSMLTMPFVKSTEVMYVNKTAVESVRTELTKAGITGYPQTWDELWKAAEILKAKYPSSTPVAYDSESNWAIAMAKQNGWNYTSAESPYYTFRNDEKFANWLDTLNAYYKAGLLTTQTIYGGYTSALYTKPATEGGAIFCIGSSGGASHQVTDKFEWDVTSIPGSKKADGSIDKSVISQGPSLVMFDSGNSEKETMTWMFVKELLDPEFQSQYARAAGYNPVRNSTFALDSYKEFLADTSSIISVTANVASTLSDWFFTSPAFEGSADARTQIGSALVSCTTGDLTGKDALERAYKNCGGK